MQLRQRRQRHRQRREGHAGKLGLDVLALEGALDLPEEIVEPAPVAALLPRVRQHRQRVAIPRIKFQRALQRGLAVGMAPLLNVKRAEVQPHDGRGYAVTRVVAEDKAGDLVEVVTDMPREAVRELPISRVMPEVGERVVVVGRL